jgi:hypothetical protein
LLVDRAVETLPRVELTVDQARRIVNGLSIGASPTEAEAPAGAEFAAFGPDGKLIGIMAKRPDGSLRAIRNLPTG